MAKKRKTKRKNGTRINQNAKANKHLARKVMGFKWNKKKNCWVSPAPQNQEIKEFNPINNRTHADWLLTACQRYSLEKISEDEYSARLTLPSGKWVFAVGSNECEAICIAFLQLTDYNKK